MRLQVILLSWLVFGLACVDARGAAMTRNAVVAVVNDAVITYKDVQKEAAPQVEFLMRAYGPATSAFEQRRVQLEQEVVEQLVRQELILHEYENSEFSIPESLIEDEVERDAREYGGRLALMKSLQGRGITFEAYRRRVRERVILDLMWRHHVPRDPVISPTRIEEYYQANPEEFQVEDQVKLRMIVIPHNPDDPSYSARKLAEEVVTKIDAGVPFAEMATIYSAGSQAPAGGDWDWVEKSVLREDLAEHAFSLKAGEHSGVIEAEDACYVMLVEDIKASHVKPLAEVRQEIETALKDQEKNRLRQKWIERLKKESFVQYF